MTLTPEFCRVARLDRSTRRSLHERLRAANLAFARISRKRPLDLEMVFDAHRHFHLTLTSDLAGPRLSRLLTEVRAQLERYEWSYAVLLAAPELGERERAAPFRHHWAGRPRHLVREAHGMAIATEHHQRNVR